MSSKEQENIQPEEELQQETIVNESNEEATNEEVVNEENQPSELELLQEELETQKDKYLRLSAEFDNYRKRTMKEKADLIKSGGEECLKNLLPIVDDFERSLQALNTATDLQALVEGVNLIYNKFKGYLAQNGVKEIEAVNTPFNTEYHEAVTTFPVEDPEKKGKVIDCVQKGYTMNDKVIRFSKVVVGE